MSGQPPASKRPKLDAAAAASPPPSGYGARVTLLLVGDIHGDPKELGGSDREDRMNQLRAELHASDNAFTAVLLNGDLANVPRPDAQNPEASAHWLPWIARQLEMAAGGFGREHAGEDPGPSRGDRRAYYVPGNHDPPQLFDEAQTAAAAATKGCDALNSATNLHGRVTRLAPGLLIGGLGGSTPARQEGEGGALTQVWGGCPYNTEQEAAAVIQGKLAPAVEAALQPEDQLLLMSHAGPDGVGTALHWRDVSKPPIRSGSTALTDYLRSPTAQQRFVGVVHGHTHPGGGQGHIGALPVFNPGPLRDGAYAVLTLVRSEEEGQLRWRVAQYEQRRLSGCLHAASVAA